MTYKKELKQSHQWRKEKPISQLCTERERERERVHTDIGDHSKDQETRACDQRTDYWTNPRSGDSEEHQSPVGLHWRYCCSATICTIHTTHVREWTI